MSQTTDGHTMTYSEREREFMFAKNRLIFHEVVDTSRMSCFFLIQFVVQYISDVFSKQ